MRRFYPLVRGSQSPTKCIGLKQMDNGAALSILSQDIRNFRYCIEKPTKNPLLHEPRPVLQVSSSARICIAGQAPGTRVHASGKPFTDPSGDRLRQWMGIGDEDFYNPDRLAIIPMGFCFPGLDAKGGDLPPRPECAPLWRQKLFDLMPQIELILVIGLYAQKWHLGDRRGKSLTETVGRWQEFVSLDSRPKVLPLPHPSWRNSGWLKKNPWFESDVLPYLRAEVQKLL